MITAICNDILGALAGITGVKKVDAWAGDIDTLMKMPGMLPGIFLVFPGTKFDTGPAAIGTVKVDTSMQFQILLLVSSLQSPKNAAIVAWGIMEGIRAKLIGRQVLTYNKLWPDSEELVFSEGGLLVYGLNYTLDARV